MAVPLLRASGGYLAEKNRLRAQVDIAVGENHLQRYTIVIAVGAVKY